MAREHSSPTLAIPYRDLGRTGEKVSAIGLGGWHLGLPHVDEQLEHPHRRAPRSTAASPSSTTPGTTTTARARSGWARRCATATGTSAFLMTKIDGRSKKEADAPARRIAAPAPDRSHRPGAASRGDPLRGPASHLRRGRRERGARRGAAGRQDPLHRLHRPQGPAHPPAHARRSRASTASPSTPCRCRST